MDHINSQLTALAAGRQEHHGLALEQQPHTDACAVSLGVFHIGTNAHLWAVERSGWGGSNSHAGRSPLDQCKSPEGA